jgi:hypothetical protein
MSYESESVLDKTATLETTKEILVLLGYENISDGLEIKDRHGCYMWYDTIDYRSYVGVELDIYKAKGESVVVTTRSRLGRSYWDLIHQNRTIKMLRDLFGGTFTTDFGHNRYFQIEGSPPEPISSGCYLARWRLNNALIRPILYLNQRGLDQPSTKETGIPEIDEMNPKLFSNNLVLPYLVAIWEDYFKSSFISVCRYSAKRQTVLKNVKSKLSEESLEKIAAGEITIEDAIVEKFSFQRPNKIVENFKLLDPKIDLASCFKQPYQGQEKSLHETINDRVTHRNEFVHAGAIDIKFTEQELMRTLNNFEVAADRCYDAFGNCFNFVPIRDLIINKYSHIT